MEVERGLWRSCGPTPLLKQGQLEQDAWTISREFCSIFKDGDSKTSLGNLCWCLVTLTSVPQRHIPGSCSNWCAPQPPGPFLRSSCPARLRHHVLLPGIFLPQVQDFVLSFIEVPEVPVSSFFQPIDVLQDGSATLWWTSHSSKLCIGKPAEGTLCLII